MAQLITPLYYDFVGEDPRLQAALAERMKVLQGAVDLSDQKTPPWGHRAPASSDMHPPPAPAFEFKPDYLNSSLKSPQLVNVSLDYGEFYNASELLRGDADLFPGPGGRRSGPPWYNYDPTGKEYNAKILNLMRHLIYAARRKIGELDTLIHRFQNDPRFRMGYIYNHMDDWMKSLRLAYRSITVRRLNKTRVKRVIEYYEFALRMDIDITYTIEYVVFLHIEYLKLMQKVMLKDGNNKQKQNRR